MYFDNKKIYILFTLFFSLFIVGCSLHGGGSSGFANDTASFSLRGIVTDSSGAAVEGAIVSAFSVVDATKDAILASYQNMPYSSVRLSQKKNIFTAVTKSDGSYFIEHLPAGQFSINISKNNKVIGLIRNVSLGNEIPEKNYDYEIKGTGNISGKLSGKVNGDINGLLLCLEGTQFFTQTKTISGKMGSYEFKDIPEGKYVIKIFESAGNSVWYADNIEIEVKAGETVSPPDMKMSRKKISQSGKIITGQALNMLSEGFFYDTLYIAAVREIPGSDPEVIIGSTDLDAYYNIPIENSGIYTISILNLPSNALLKVSGNTKVNTDNDLKGPDFTVGSKSSLPTFSSFAQHGYISFSYSINYKHVDYLAKVNKVTATFISEHGKVIENFVANIGDENFLKTFTYKNLDFGTKYTFVITLENTEYKLKSETKYEFESCEQGDGKSEDSPYIITRSEEFFDEPKKNPQGYFVVENDLDLSDDGNRTLPYWGDTFAGSITSPTLNSIKILNLKGSLANNFKGYIGSFDFHLQSVFPLFKNACGDSNKSGYSGLYSVEVNVSDKNYNKADLSGLIAETISQPFTLSHVTVDADISIGDNCSRTALFASEIGTDVNLNRCKTKGKITKLSSAPTTKPVDLCGFTFTNKGTITECENKCSIVTNCSSAPSSFVVVSGFCKTNDGIIKNCIQSASLSATGKSAMLQGYCFINNKEIINCKNESSNSDNYFTVGSSVGCGFCRLNNGKVSECVNNMKFKGGSDSRIGCIVGENEKDLLNCTNHGPVETAGNSWVSGICLANNGKVSNCNNGSVNEKNEFILGSGSVVGGICCANDCSNCEFSSCNNYFNITVNGSKGGIYGVSGLIADMSSVKITECSNYGNLTGGETIAGISGPIENTDAVSITDCKNFGDLSGAANIYGISSMKPSAELIINNCENTKKVNDNPLDWPKN